MRLKTKATIPHREQLVRKRVFCGEGGLCSQPGTLNVLRVSFHQLWALGSRRAWLVWAWNLCPAGGCRASLKPEAPSSPSLAGCTFLSLTPPSWQSSHWHQVLLLLSLLNLSLHGPFFISSFFRNSMAFEENFLFFFFLFWSKCSHLCGAGTLLSISDWCVHTPLWRRAIMFYCLCSSVW